MHIHREQLAEAARTWEALSQAEYMASDVMHHAAFGQVLLDIGAHSAQGFGAADHRSSAAEQALIDFG